MEVLIAILVLAIGAGGVITMQLHALRMTQESGFLLSASQLAAELAERMRESHIEDYLFAFASNTDSTSGETKPVPISTTCYQHACDGVMMASFTISDWQHTLEQRLPQARARVCRDQPPADIDAPPRWDCDQLPDSALIIKIGWTSRSHSNQIPALVFVTGK